MDERPAVRMYQAELFEGPQRTWRNGAFREAVQPALAALIARVMTVREEVNDDRKHLCLASMPILGQIHDFRSVIGKLSLTCPQV